MEDLRPRDLLFPDEVKSPFHDGIPYELEDEDPPFGVPFSPLGLGERLLQLLLLLLGLLNMSEAGEPSEIGISNTHLGDSFSHDFPCFSIELFDSFPGSCWLLRTSSTAIL